MENTREKSVGIIILNWNGGKTTLDCLVSISNLKIPTGYRITVFLVDNGSVDDSLDICESYEWSFEIHIIKNYANLGFADGNNSGIKAALESKTDYIFILNNDTSLVSDCLVNLMASFDILGESVILGATLCSIKNPHIIDFIGAQWDIRSGKFKFNHEGDCIDIFKNRLRETDFVCGGALIAPSAAFANVGGFDGRFFLTWEDVDWCYRSKNKGYKCYIVENARVLHYISASFNGVQSPLRIYYSYRNRLLWAQKHLPFYFKAIVLLSTVRGLFHIPPFKIEKKSFRGYYWALRTWSFSLFNDPLRYARYAGLRDYIFGIYGECRLKKLTKMPNHVISAQDKCG